MRIFAPPGTRDSLPEEIRMRRFVESVFMEHCRCYGYNEIHTPVFEYSELFEDGVGHVTDIVEKELYTFADKHGDRLALRPEGTTGVARAFIQHDMANELPRKFCYKITCYRQEDPEEGRLREFHQIGAECYGSKNPQADSEVIILAYTALKSMGADKLTLNINSLGCDSCRVGYINTLTRYLLPHANSGELCPTCLSRMSRNPLRVLDCKNPSCRAVAEKAPKLIDFLCSDCRSHFEMVGRNLKAAGVPFNIKTRLIRGLDYYNRTVFEIKAGEGGANGTVCGGGRYDRLCRRIGAEKNVPAVGFAIGEERAIIAMRECGIKEIPPDTPRAWIMSVDAVRAGRGAAKLRSFGIYTERDLMGLDMKGQRDAAVSAGARWLITAEENDICAVDAENGREYTFSKDDWAEVARIIN
ncbi:MAG: histidine--tRNA ligase [Clostridia bacterium]